MVPPGKYEAPADPRLILVIRRRYIGDLVLLEPFLRNLKSAYPRAQLVLIADQGYGDALRNCESIDRILELPRRGPLRERLAAWRQVIRGLRGPRFDLAFDLARNEQAAVTLLLSRARRRVSFEVRGEAGVRRRKPLDIWRRRLLTTDLVQLDRADQIRTHVVDWNNGFLRSVQIPTPHRKPQIPIRHEDRKRARDILKVLLEREAPGRPFALIHLGGRGDAKKWPTERFAQLADILEEEFDHAPVLTAGPGEESILHETQRHRKLGGGALLEAPTSLGTLSALMAEAAVVIGNDSGPAHMAAAARTPTCVLFGATRPTMWRTLGESDQYLRPSVPCGESCVRPQECSPQKGRYCVQRIEVNEVVASLARILRPAPTTSSGQDPEPPS